MAGWLSDEVPHLNRLIVMRALCDLGICETPEGSNRGGRIDGYNRRAGAPLGSYGCASWATAVWVDCRATVPPTSRASCDVVMAWAQREGQWSRRAPVVGAFVLYGTEADASHIGILIRTAPYLISIEGNAAWGGHSRNGEAVVCRRVDLARVVGFVHPVLRSA
jgi:hypothetical protein